MAIAATEPRAAAVQCSLSGATVLRLPASIICLDGCTDRADKSAAIGVVICNPFGYEAICSHRSVRTFAEAAAAAGAPTLRFDYARDPAIRTISTRAPNRSLGLGRRTYSQRCGAAAAGPSGVERVCLLGVPTRRAAGHLGRGAMRSRKLTDPGGPGDQRTSLFARVAYGASGRLAERRGRPDTECTGRKRARPRRASRSVDLRSRRPRSAPSQR